MKLDTISNMFAALAQETRLKIFRLLSPKGEKGICAGDISKILKIPKNTLSFHLLLLNNAGVLGKRREGKCIFYFVNHDDVREAAHFLFDQCTCGHEGCPGVRRK